MEIPDNAKVEFTDGAVIVNNDYENTRSPQTLVRKWRQQQTHEHLAVLVPKVQMDAFKKALPAFGAKIA